MNMLYSFISRLFLIFCINVSFSSSNFGDSERNSVIKILNVFTNNYFCENENNIKKAVESTSTLNTTEANIHDGINSNKSQQVCFTRNLPITIYATCLNEEYYFEKHGNQSEGLKLQNVEDLTNQIKIIDSNFVLVIDIYPFSKFGHPVVMYRIRKLDKNRDLNIKPEYITDHGVIEEISPTGLQDPNTKWSDEESFIRSHYNFIPVVFTEQRHQQLLTCLTNDYLEVEGIEMIDYTCRIPARYSKSSLKLHEDRIKRSSASLSRGPLSRSSSSHSSFSSSSSLSTFIDWTRPLYVHPSSGQCHLFTICDYAVVISGGWNQRTVTEQEGRFSREIVRMLGRFGFLDRNVQLFDGFQTLANRSNGFFKATTKADIRRQITHLCSREHCVNSLVIYLNAPTLSNGDMLLGDGDNDGIINSSREVYSVEEITQDLKDCLAQQVVMIADQSNSDRLLMGLKGQAWHHKVVAGFASGRGYKIPFKIDDDRYKPTSASIKFINKHGVRRIKMTKNKFGIPDRRFAFTSIWLDVNHTKNCIQDVFQISQRKSRLDWRPLSFLGSLVPRHNIYGAPCDTHRLLSKQELEENYFGCQNLPRRLIEYRAQKAILPHECDMNT